jgi:hypothetical protein
LEQGRGIPLAIWRGSPHNFKMADSKPKVIFDPLQMKDRKSWCVRVTFPHGPQSQISGFSKKAEAIAWIERESADWLKQYEGGKDAKASQT